MSLWIDVCAHKMVIGAELARTFFEECKATQSIVFASLHVREGRVYRMATFNSNLEDLELDR